MANRATGGRLRRLLNLSFSSVGASFDQGPFWTRSMLGSTIGDKELVENDFRSYVQAAYKANGIVFALVLARLAVFSQARFQFQRLVNGRPADLFGTPALRLLEEPWPNGTTSDLLARMEQDASLAGNFFATPVGEAGSERIRRMRPDWATIVTGSRSGGGPFALDAEPVALIYQPPQSDPTILPIDRVIHYAPIPDPEAQWRGMSWVTSVLNEVQADSAATKHKSQFFKRGATSNLAITYDKGITPTQVKDYATLFAEQFDGVENAYKTLHLGGGADPKMTGVDFKQLDFKVTQGAGESRIAAASGVGAVVAQFSEGMAGAALNAGNYGAARRRFSDVTMQHLWTSAAGSLAKLTEPPAGSRLWFDVRDVPFLQEDAKDDAEIRHVDAQSVRQLTEAGYTPDSIKLYVKSGDVAQLEHTGLFSIQLQPAGGPGPDLPAA